MEIHHKRHRKFKLDPGKAALLVIDLQDYFTNKGSHAFIPASTNIIPKINELAATFHALDRPVIFTRHIDADPTNVMNRWWEDMITETDPLSQINDELDTRKSEILIKHQYDAFMNTDLEAFLKSKGITQVVITGVVTHLCCETTARSAFMRNFEVFFVTDCTAAKNIEHHNAAIFNLSYGFAVPVRYENIINTLSPFGERVGVRGD